MYILHSCHCCIVLTTELNINHADSMCVSYLVEELFACCVGLDGKLQLSVHGCNSDIYLPGGKTLMVRYRRERKSLLFSHLCRWRSFKEHAEQQLGEKKVCSVIILFVLLKQFVGSLTAK